MSEGRVDFELVSPETLLLSEAVEMVVVPGDQGDFGVLPGHAPMISTIRAGVIHVFAGNAVQQRIFVAGGFAEVTPERCTVLAEEAVVVGDIDRGMVEQELKDLSEDVEDAADDEERAVTQARLDVARAKLIAIEEPLYQ
ncbi:MAG: F0F1 ATP synthase subunit epsilon [Alphaproteobacteria bacterium]